MEKEKLIKLRNEIKEHTEDITTISGLSSLFIYAMCVDNVRGGIIVQSAVGTMFVGYAAYKLSKDVIPNAIDNEIIKKDEKTRIRVK